MSELAAAIVAELRRHGDPARAEGERAYLKSDLTHLGVSVPETRRIVARLVRSAPSPGIGRDETLRTAWRLWDSDVHEHRLAAAMLLAATLAALRVDDLELVERMLRSADTWALVDPLAVHVAGDLLPRLPAAETTYRRWAADEHMWVRRAGILAFLPAIRAGEGFPRYFPVLATTVEPLLGDGRFFVAKAIGWVLREAAKKHPAEVCAWLSPRAGRASTVTIREVVRVLPAEDGVRLRAARRGG